MKLIPALEYQNLSSYIFKGGEVTWELMVPPLSQKVAIFTDLGQGSSSKVGFFLIC